MSTSSSWRLVLNIQLKYIPEKIANSFGSDTVMIFNLGPKYFYFEDQNVV